MEQATNVLQGSIGDNWLTIVSFIGSEVLAVGNGLAFVSVLVVGSMFWQATRQMREENDYFMPMIEPIYCWKTDALLKIYVLLLVTLIGLTVGIACSPIDDFIFWFGFAGVFAGQLTKRGQRMSRSLLSLLLSAFSFHNRSAH